MEWSDGSPTFDQWTEMFRSCRRSAVHLELRDLYAVSDEDPLLVRWRAGHRDDPADRASWWRPWLTLIEETTGRGVAVRRARIVSEPLTEYIQFEYDMTFTNAIAGEDIRWLPRRQASALALPGNDFWLLDGERVMFNHFTGNGDWLGVEWSNDSAVVKLCETAFERVWERGVPHTDYRPS